MHCSSTAGVRAPLSSPPNLADGGDDIGLSLGGETDKGVKTWFGDDPRVACWEGDDGGFVDRVK